jgi:NAD(P)-dependent dehydrogenase (short-subunit alcohol dehydrogenase family)
MFTPQTPLGSGFTAHSTTLDVIRGIDLIGKLAIVTGGYAGLGLEAARTLVSAGARVIVPARDMARARRSISDIGGGIEVRPMDLTDPASINAFAHGIVQSGMSLHILINSAGIMADPNLARDARGHELQFSTNHLGHFQLTMRLWPALRRAQGARRFRVVAGASLLRCRVGRYPEPSTYAKKFTNKYEHRLIQGGIGHNLPQEAPQAFAEAVVDVDRFSP